jgi:hypothetical protein
MNRGKEGEKCSEEWKGREEERQKGSGEMRGVRGEEEREERRGSNTGESVEISKRVDCRAEKRWNKGPESQVQIHQLCSIK